MNSSKRPPQKGKPHGGSLRLPAGWAHRRASRRATPVAVPASERGEKGKERQRSRSEEDAMIMWVMACAVIGGMAVAVGGVLRIAGGQTRQEEEAVERLAQVDRPAA